MKLNHQKMNKLHQIAFKIIPMLTVFIVFNAIAQTQTKKYSESFKVNENTVLSINTSHADIEFDTWNKKEVLVEAIIEIEGASEEEAEKYFKDNGIKILGNSSEIEISTRHSSSWGGAHISGVPGYPEDIVIEIPEIPEIEPFFLDIQIPELPEAPMLAEIPPMPPMPPMGISEFDYQEYQERGEDYLEEWREKFMEEFDEEWVQQIEEWGVQLRANMAEHERMREEHRAERDAIREEHRKEREELRREAEELRREALEEQERAREEARMAREEARRVERNVIISSDKDVAPKIYYYSSDGKSKKYQVKRRIKIRMPKSVKLNMNVRHGEVKLAGNTRDIKANLSYASLYASTIDGAGTQIIAAYSPVHVEQWNLGSLNTRYSGEITLDDVANLTLDATSSEVTIDRLLKSAKVKNNLGALYIRSVAPEFSNLEISVQNGRMECNLPATAYTIKAKGSYSAFTFPQALKIQESGDAYQKQHQGYHLNKDSDRSIVINSRYSEVNLKE